MGIFKCTFLYYGIQIGPISHAKFLALGLDEKKWIHQLDRDNWLLHAPAHHAIQWMWPPLKQEFTSVYPWLSREDFLDVKQEWGEPIPAEMWDVGEFVIEMQNIIARISPPGIQDVQPHWYYLEMPTFTTWLPDKDKSEEPIRKWRVFYQSVFGTRPSVSILQDCITCGRTKKRKSSFIYKNNSHLFVSCQKRKRRMLSC